MKTPLNSILSLLKIILNLNKDEKIDKMLKIVNSSAEILVYLVSDMLDLFAIKTERFKRYEKPTKIKEEIVN